MTCPSRFPPSPISGSMAWPETTVPLDQATLVVPSAARVIPPKVLLVTSTLLK